MPRVVGILALAIGVTGVVTAAQIEDLVAVIREGGILVSFGVSDAFEPDIEHAIETGLEVSFRYNVELKRVRGVWFDQRVAKRAIRVTVAYDNLTKRYSLTRQIDGEIDATDVVADAEAMRRFMTRFEALPLFEVSIMEPNEEYYLRVKGVMMDRTVLLFIPWDIGTGWREAHFTYLP